MKRCSQPASKPEMARSCSRRSDSTRLARRSSTLPSFIERMLMNQPVSTLASVGSSPLVRGISLKERRLVWIVFFSLS